MVSLSFRDLGGEGTPIVLLHGLFGSSQNWTGVGRRLAALGHAYALDLRNHGDSPHTPRHSLEDCVEDLRGWAELNAHGPVKLLGHSMGGLVAMGYAISRPAMVERLVVVDMAPRAYPLDHEQEFAALSTEISGCRSRREIDALLRTLVPDERVRSFLLTNAVRLGTGFRWRLNVSALRASPLPGSFAGMRGSFERAALFLAGGKSQSIREEDHARIRTFFPRAAIEVIAAADHWVHASAPGPFFRSVEDFFSRDDTSV